ncbi:MAG: type II toxin-antitoxin system RelE/ParE family toxin [Chloroflexi bacterium]|nr:type II toxin-antitoxin system RelE/ParE family toxin [Chloroflexota bacterium]
MAYRVEFSRRADRDFRALARQVQERLRQRIDALERNPRPVGAARLSAQDPLYRIRAGDYRIIYAVRDDILLVLVVQVGHRRDVYRRIPG